jgi:energy-coupling factor transporter ATP-binding protein EcfA2
VAEVALLEIKDFHFTYPGGSRQALNGIELAIEQGEWIVLCGPSGCGKTTLLRQLKAELTPVGKREGELLFRGVPLQEHAPESLVRQIGMVQQDPENQIVMEQVQQELAFGLENLHTPTDVMRRRIAEMAHFFGMEGWLYRKTSELSGGQKQLLNLASVLLLQPDILLLDEPTAQLDPVAAKEFLQLVRRLNEEMGLTVIMTEHRLEELFPMADRIVMMNKQGSIEHAGAPREVISAIGAMQAEGSMNEYFDYMPSMTKLVLSVTAVSAGEGEVPLTVKEGRTWLDGALQTDTAIPILPHQTISAQSSTKQVLLECKELSYQYEKNGAMIIKQLDLAVYENDFLAIVGGNGAGKSTLLQLMAGLLQPRSGVVRFQGKNFATAKESEIRSRIGYLSQNPMGYFLYDTVEEELRQAVQRSQLANAEEEMERLVSLFGLQTLMGMHPHDLSGGERQKSALACVLLAGPELLLLDEPTKGLDPLTKQSWGDLLQGLNQAGLAIVIVTHDIEFAAQYVKRCAMLFDGAMTSEGVPARFFSDNYFYTTVINRLVRNRFPQALTYKDVLNQWPGRG